MCVVLFCYKQMTAYGMRISDWSSDVCSSDLHRLDGLGVDRWPEDAEALAEGPHPQMVLIELLAAGQGAPGDQIVDGGVASVVADLLRFDDRPGRGREMGRAACRERVVKYLYILAVACTYKKQRAIKGK